MRNLDPNGATAIPTLLDDYPLETMEDLSPGHQKLASQLAGVLENGTSTPILITGDWGSGKTSVLKAVRSHIEGDPSGEPKTAFFEAWHYENQEGLLAALLRCLWLAARSSQESGANVKQLWGKLWRCAVVAGSRTLPLAASAFGLTPLFEILKGIKIGDLAVDLTAIDDTSEFTPPGDPVAELRESFSEFVKAAWPDDAPTVFIDDLDRCSPQGAVALLEGIRLLVAGDQNLGCRFVAALDREILVQAVSQKYAGLPAFDGNRYLEKVFPLELQVPQLNRDEAASVVKTLLGAEPNADHFEALATALAHPSFANPRLMKRSINTFRLVVHLEHEHIEGAEATILARWIVASKRWPELRRLMQRHDVRFWSELYTTFEKASNIPADPEAHALLSERGAQQWLRSVGLLESDSNTARRYRDADNRLRSHGL